MRIDPGRELLRCIEILDILVRADEHVLHDIDDVVVLREELSAVAQELRFIALHEYPEKLLVALLYARRERLVAHLLVRIARLHIVQSYTL